MNERGRIRFGNTTIDYEVRRSKRRKKTVQITTDGGGVQVAAPMTTPDSELRAIVRKRAPWILSHASGEMLEAAPKRFVSGETLPYLGRNVRMIVDTADVRSPKVRFDHWRFRVTVPHGLDDSERYERIRRSVVKWYRDRVMPHFEFRGLYGPRGPGSGARSSINPTIQPRLYSLSVSPAAMAGVSPFRVLCSLQKLYQTA